MSAAANGVKQRSMVWIYKSQFVVTGDGSEAGAIRCPAGVTEVPDLLPVPAAWPAGVSQLAQAVDACQRDAAVLARARQAKA
jgi:hypothetical protein